MNVETFRLYCLAKRGVTESFPFDKKTLVFKVRGKMFALTNVDSFEFVNLKCDPEKALELREVYQGITPGYHMNKKHWNSVATKADISDKNMVKWLDDSYNLIVASLSKKTREELKKQIK